MLIRPFVFRVCQAPEPRVSGCFHRPFYIMFQGALAGGMASLAFMSWVCLGTQAAIAAGDINFQTKPVSIEGCTYDFVTPTPVVTNLTLASHKA
jgi:hypothetical protein